MRLYEHIVKRYFIYIVGYFVVSNSLLFIFGMIGKKVIFEDYFHYYDYICTALIFIGLALFMVYSEYSNIKWRKKNGFDIYNEISDNQLIEAGFLEKTEDYISLSKRKSRVVGYWFDLKESGAITEEEFLAKKKELLKNR